MDKKLRGAAVVGQSGGPTAAINATLAGVIRACLADGETFSRIYGMRNGIDGFLEGRFLDLGERFTTPGGEVDEDALCLLSVTPSAALGSCRKKLPDPEADPGFFERLIASFASLDIRYFFYIGGNDSMDTVAKITRYLEQNPVYDMLVVGVPKTVDNDLWGTDHTPGFGSAAKYIATTVSEIVRDCAVYTVRAVTIVETMGRDAGWMAASAALSRVNGNEGPDYIYLMEVPFTMERLFRDLERAFERHPNVVIVVSEGLRFPDGRYVGEGEQTGAVDIFGHKYLAGTARVIEKAIKVRFGCKVRSIELNLPQRCAAHLASATDLSEAEEVGRCAVRAAARGETGVMAVIRRDEGNSYSVSYGTEAIADIANGTRTVPTEYISPESNDVTDACVRYLLPLIQGDPEIPKLNGLPVQLIL